MRWDAATAPSSRNMHTDTHRSTFCPQHTPRVPPQKPSALFGHRGRAEGLRRGAQLGSGASSASAVRNDFSMLLLIFFPPLQLAQKMIGFGLPDHWLSLLV